MKSIELVEIKKLILDKDNPRKITKDQLNNLCESLVNDPSFIQKRPVLVNRVDDMLYVYAGTQRIRAAKKLKWKEIYCIIDDNLSDDLVKKRILRDNKHSGTWDYDLLANCYDIEMLVDCGFTTEELHLNLTPDDNDPKDKEKKKKCCPNCGHKF